MGVREKEREREREKENGWYKRKMYGVRSKLQKKFKISTTTKITLYFIKVKSYLELV